MNKTKLVLVGLAVALVLLGGGWLWGAWGRWAAEGQASAAEVRLLMSEARASLYAARVDVFEINFGQASRHLEAARKALESARASGRDEKSPWSVAVGEAIARTQDAQRLAVSVNADANSRAAEALKALDRAETAQPR